jgi:uncharacterized protein (DUF362 family)/NAD-dependent dihydropyrimidine dehydrogenase PreA subunit
MTHATVALVRCDTYEQEAVLAALRRGVDLLGGLAQFVRPGERILLKPNLLAGDTSEKAVTTHPAVLAATVRLASEGGARVLFGDAPGMEGAPQALRRSGLLEAGIAAGAEAGDFTTARALAVPGGKLVDSFPVAAAVHECDGLINLPKMKTHQLTRITGAVKNLFGCIPGQRKALYHVQHRDVFEFCDLLVDLHRALRPRLHIMDGIVAMEGNGPRSGDPRPMRVLILSADAVAVDATFSRLVALDPTYVPTTMAGYRGGIGTYREEEITIVGEALETLAQPDFQLIRKPVLANASYAFYGTLKELLLPKPVLEEASCVKCGQCVKACPVPEKALRFAGSDRQRPPQYHYDLCIRCYCCQEMCPQRAISRHTPWLGQVLRVA